MRWVWLCLAIALLAGVTPHSWAQKKTARKTAGKSAPKAAATSKSKKPAARRPSAKRRTRATTARRTYRASQQKPAPERYAEIQRALAEKGYFEGAPDGTWNDSSVQALKRFQEDQNLKADGKLSSLSLIALGLGPKRAAYAGDAAMAANAATAEEPPQPAEPK